MTAIEFRIFYTFWVFVSDQPFRFYSRYSRYGSFKKSQIFRIFSFFYYDQLNWKFQLKTDFVHYLQKSNGKLQGYCRIETMHLAEILLQESVEGIEEARIKNILQPDSTRNDWKP